MSVSTWTFGVMENAILARPLVCSRLLPCPLVNIHQGFAYPAIRVCAEAELMSRYFSHATGSSLLDRYPLSGVAAGRTSDVREQPEQASAPRFVTPGSRPVELPPQRRDQLVGPVDERLRTRGRSLSACSSDSIWALSASAIARPAAAVLCW